MCVDPVENFKIAVKISVWLSKWHALAKGRLNHVTFRTDSIFLMLPYGVAKYVNYKR